MFFIAGMFHCIQRCGRGGKIEGGPGVTSVEVSSFQGVGIEVFHCIQRCPHFRRLEFHCIQRYPHFRVLE